MGNCYKYCRVSTDTQDVARQMQAMEAIPGIIVQENVSGAAGSARKKLWQVVEKLQPGDTIVALSVDRISRNLLGLHDIINAIVREKQASLRIIDAAMEFTPSDQPNPLRDLMLNIMGGFAQFERDNLLSRQNQAYHAIRSGKQEVKSRSGRRKMLSYEQMQAAKELRAGGMSFAAIARTLGASHSTIGRLLRGQ